MCVVGGLHEPLIPFLILLNTLAVPVTYSHCFDKCVFVDCALVKLFFICLKPLKKYAVWVSNRKGQVDMHD